jgi:hypothetical protein
MRVHDSSLSHNAVMTEPQTSTCPHHPSHIPFMELILLREDDSIAVMNRSRFTVHGPQIAEFS